MKQESHIRKAVSDDSEGLQTCMNSAYSGYLERLNGNRLPPMDVDYADEIRNYPTWVFVVNSQIAGGVILAFEDRYASLANIAVHPKYQGLGIGRQLMNFAESMATKKNYSEIRLATHNLLTENVSLYTHLGWVEYDRDDMKVYMKKRI